MAVEWRGSVSRAYLHCHDHEQRLQGLVQAASPSGSRRGDPGVLRPRRVKPHITCNRRTAGNPGLERRRQQLCESKPEAKTAAFFPEKGHCMLIAFAERRMRREWVWLRAIDRNYHLISVATGLEPERDIPLHFTFIAD